jgi:poly(hydroxyalkanoate) depolymerase family esterase
MKFILLFILTVLLSTIAIAQTGWQQVTGFGSNPGALNMYSYAPAALPANAPLVVVMHGCTQNALQAAAETGWNTLADRNDFYVVYPEQVSANNSSNCFNWFLQGDQERGQGEALSIRQMVDKMKTTYSIDASRVYVTGLSAGACMTNVMLATYPEVFDKGAVLAGTPYKSATSAIDAWNSLGGTVSKTPQQWGDLVRNQNPFYTGAYPEVAIFHGTSDAVVSYYNVDEEVKQWTNVHNTDQVVDMIAYQFANSSPTLYVYNDSSGQRVV